MTTPSPLVQASERTGARLTLRLSITFLVVIGLFSTLLVRLWSLQVIQGPQLNALARATTTRTIILEPARGEIVARNGDVLAGSVAKEVLSVDAETAAQHPSDLSNLGSLFGIAPSTIAAAIKNAYGTPYSPVPVPTGAGGVTSEELAYIEDHPKLFPGVTVGLAYERTYPAGALASQLLGYVSEPGPQKETGASGLESQYNAQLTGRNGTEQVEVDPFGNLVSTGRVAAPVAGDNVVLNLDQGLEQVVTSALSNEVSSLRAGDVAGTADPAPYAAAVVLSTDGKVLASTSYPGYNNNLWVPYITTKNYNELLSARGQPLLDYVTTGLQPPGSVFKLATATAALNDGLISPYRYVDDTGSFTLGTKTYHDSEDETLGPVDMSSAIAESSDVYFYNLGADFWADSSRYGATPIQNTAAQAYGLGVTPAIDLPADEVGDRPDRQRRVAGAPPPRAPEGLPVQHVLRGRQRRSRHRPGRDRRHAARGRGRVRDVRERRHPLRPADRGRDHEPDGQGRPSFAPKVIGHVSLPSSTYAPMLAGFEGAVQGSARHRPRRVLRL